MAKDNSGLIKIALLGGVGYFLYSRMSTPAAAPATGSTAGGSFSDLVQAIKNAIGGATPAPGTPGTSTTGAPTAAGLAAALKAAAVGNALFVDGKGNAHYWNYYRNQLYPPALDLTMFPGAEADQFMTAEEFVAKLKGPLGLGAVPVILPMLLNVGGQQVLLIASNAAKGGREINAEAANLYNRRRLRVLA